MPLLNPRQAYNLLFNKYLHNDKILPFIVTLLPIASKNRHLNRKMEEIHRKFTNFILIYLKEVSNFFNLKIDDLNILDNIKTDDFYKVLYDLCQSKNKQSPTNYLSFQLDICGNLMNTVTNKYINIPEDKSYFYSPYLNSVFSVFISNHCYAVINGIYPYFEEDTLYSIQLISLVLAASGYHIILCLYNSDPSYNILGFLQNNVFTEVHIFSNIGRTSENIYNELLNSSDYGYVYLYVHFENVEKEYRKKLLELSNKYIKIFTLTKTLNLNSLFSHEESIFYSYRSLIKNETEFEPEEKDLSGFLKKTLPINLCNVALYSSENRKTDWSPVKLSEIGYGIIQEKDFKYNKYRRIPVTIDSEKYYVEFDDLHFMNPELYVSDPIYLTKHDFNTSIIENIQKTYKNKTTIVEKIKIKNSNIDTNIEAKMHNAFHYLSKYTKNDKNEHFEPYSSQIYAVYRAISHLSNVHEGSKQKGVILEVKTGEGKSFIVQALAEHLARQGNTVHIATSNIILAARDYEKAYNYYRNCERKSTIRGMKQQRPSILIHKEERKYIESFLKKTNNGDEYTVDEAEYDSFYSDNNFENSTNMNISVCLNNNKIKSNIVYSTFLNFEALYLSLNEKEYNFETNYINNCYLIIDEADTILIDEIMNGTILAKPMKSNAPEVLKLIYENYAIGVKDKSVLLKMVIKNFPECEKDMKEDDIQRIIKDIEKINSNDFGNKKTYIISEVEKIPKKKGYNLFTKKQPKTVKKIVTFNSGNKGIAEPNKIFSGFIHQLIGIKEKYDNPKENKDLEIEPLSMNYLHLSHPIYVKMYKGVCGVTGTIGSKKDKEILEYYYDLSTEKVPRHQMSLRNDLPPILCKNMEERNERICQEVISFHKIHYPVLVIFNDLNEIDAVKEILVKNYKIVESTINVFDGSNKADSEINKNTLEKKSGKANSITLGTNYCGRGVSIEYSSKPLCVIVTYYNEDKRSIFQVLGRAGRNGYPGLSRIICTKYQFYGSGKTCNKDDMDSILKRYNLKKQAQLYFTFYMKRYHPWLFDETEYKEKIPKDKAMQLRNCNINVNRMTAYKWKFPICMSVETFLDIQSQRIFSLKNCPECKYTWNLFRIYLRELVHESWSLFIESVDNNYPKVEKDKTYEDFLNEEYSKYRNLIFQYIPNDLGCSAFDTFYFIHNKVVNNWGEKIMGNIPENIRNKSEIRSKDGSYTSFKFGFFPMSLTADSGSRVSKLTEDEKGSSYITDPELRYIKESYGFFSITKWIDKIFENFQSIADNKLLSLFGIRFFLRRTLGGCELGVCVDPQYICEDTFPHCLIDQNPLLMLTICTKSTFFWLAGILIVLLIFVTSISIMIFSQMNPLNLGSEIKNFIKKLFQGSNEPADNIGIIPKGFNIILDAIIQKLQQLIRKNIDKRDEGFGIIIDAILNLFVPIETQKIDEIINSKVFLHMKIKENARKYMDGFLPFGKLLKIAILLIISFCLFLSNFKSKNKLNYEKKIKKSSSSFMKESKICNYQIESFDSYKDTQNELKKDIESKYLQDFNK